MAKLKEGNQTAAGGENPPAAADPRQVEVICDGVLGTKLLAKGTVTNDAEYVALLNTERGLTLVRVVE